MIKSRNPSNSASPQPAQSLEAVRQRARHRLIGASVLVFLGVVGFPLLFDTEPRPLAVDVPIDIPAKGASAPVSQQAAKSANASGSKGNASVATQKSLPVDAGLSKQETVVERLSGSDPKPVPRAETAAKRAPSGSEASAAPKAAAATAAQPALGERFIIQLGSFADNAKAQALRYKVQASGLKTYTHVIDTPEGKLTRVRVGPFATRAEADRVEAKLKAIGVSGRMLNI